MTDPIFYATLPSGIARIVLDRADTRNAQDTAFLYALNDAFDRAAQDDAIKVIVLSANGPHFSSGHDLREVGGHENMRKHDTVGTWGGFGKPGVEAQYAREQEIYLGFCERWRNIPKPTMALVHGKVIAGGLMLMWPCDLIVAADDAEFRMAEVSLGLVPDLTGTGRLIRLVGYQRALEICATGRHVHADEAVRIGLALCSVPPDELDATVADLAAALVESPADAVRAVKGLLAGALDRTAEEQRAAERAAQVPLIARLATAARAAADSDAAR